VSTNVGWIGYLIVFVKSKKVTYLKKCFFGSLLFSPLVAQLAIGPSGPDCPG